MADACGITGATCGRCGTGTVCQAGECRVGGTGGGTGGGATGGGSGGGLTGGGTGGSTGSTCRQIGNAETSTSNLIIAEYRTFNNSPGHSNFVQWGYQTGASTFDSFRVEVIYPNDLGPRPPVTQPFTNVGYFSCSVCALFFEGCSSQSLDCAKTYLAQSGSVTISRADRAAEGRITGQASTMHLTQWDLMTDRAVANGGCVEIANVGPWNEGWNNDGGVVP